MNDPPKHTYIKWELYLDMYIYVFYHANIQKL